MAHSTGGDSYIKFDVKTIDGLRIEFFSYIESGRVGSQGIYPLAGVSIELFADHEVLVLADPNFNAHIGLVQRFPTMNLPENLDFKFFHVSVFTKNGHYTQNFLFKKAQDGRWYFHIMRWNDIHQFSLREETYEENYPPDLKLQVPQISDYRPKSADERNSLSAWPGARPEYRRYGL